MTNEQKELFDIFEPVMKLTIDKKIQPLETNIKQTIAGLVATVDQLRNELKLKDDVAAKLNTENASLKKDLAEVKKQNDNFEQFCRKDNLVITGIKATYAERAGASADSTTEIVSGHTR